MRRGSERRNDKLRQRRQCLQFDWVRAGGTPNMGDPVRTRQQLSQTSDCYSELTEQRYPLENFCREYNEERRTIGDTSILGCGWLSNA